MTEQEWRQILTAEGYQDLQICENGPHTKFPEHTHEQPTVHVILHGSFTLFNEQGAHIFKEGDRLEIPAGTTHRVVCGPDGCTFLVGQKV